MSHYATSEGRLYKKAHGQESKLVDKNYDTHDFVRELRPLQVTPPVAQHTTRRSSAIAGRITRHPGSAVSQLKSVFQQPASADKISYNSRMRKLQTSGEMVEVTRPNEYSRAL
jgi:hypothetical protein